MFGIQSDIIKSAALMFVGCLLAAAFIGFSLLKFYEEFRKGVELQSRLRIWAAFAGLAFIVILFATILVRFAR